MQRLLSTMITWEHAETVKTRNKFQLEPKQKTAKNGKKITTQKRPLRLIESCYEIVKIIIINNLTKLKLKISHFLIFFSGKSLFEKQKI